MEQIVRGRYRIELLTERLLSGDWVPIARARWQEHSGAKWVSTIYAGRHTTANDAIEAARERAMADSRFDQWQEP